METLHTILGHRTIRKYKSDPLPDTILEQILKAAIRAPTTGNMQVYSIIVSKEEESRKRLWDLHFKQNMVLQAPVLLTFCADFNRFNTWCLQRKAEPGYGNFLSFFTAAIDALLAAQNATLAAEDLGLGACYLGTTTYMAAEIAEYLQCPSGVVPVTTLVVGYPDEDPGLTDRLPIEAVLHHEKYQHPGEEQINEFYAEKEASPLTKQLLTENNLESLAQVFTQKRYTRKDNEYFSIRLLAFLTKQGFMNQ